MTSCAFPGSFNPVTNGHMDLIRRASKLFDRVSVVVMVNLQKHEVIPTADRVRMLEKACEGLPNVQIAFWNGLLAEYMARNNEFILIRGIRNSTELDHEYSSWLVNRQLNKQIEMLWIPTDPELAYVSSSAVREIAGFGGDISKFVPRCVLKDIKEFLSKE